MLLPLAAALALAAPAPALEVEPSCGALPIARMIDSTLDRAARCLEAEGAGARARQLRALFAPNAPRKLVVSCDRPDDSAEGLPGEGTGPNRLSLSRRGAAPDTIFHELVHILDSRFHHGYTPGVPDMAVSCEACCFGGSAYLDSSRTGPNDRAGHCAACAAGPQASETRFLTAYRRDLFRQGAESESYHFARNFVLSLGDAGIDPDKLDEWIEERDRPRLCAEAARYGMFVYRDGRALPQALSRAIAQRCARP